MRKRKRIGIAVLAAIVLIGTGVYFFQRQGAVKIEVPLVPPDSSRYTKVVLAEGLDEPVAMDVLPNNNVLFIERKGGVRLYVDKEKQLKSIYHFNVFSGIEDGLLGMAADPGFEKNNWVYFYYSVPGDRWVNRLSRFELDNETLRPETEKILLEIPTQRKYCCHAAGAIVFDSSGLLYLATGDNTNAEEAEGYVPLDERPGHELADAQATAANSNDLRGKILRIRPEEDGSYTIPEGNLFPVDGSKGRPEIYVMGCRNPYRLSTDPKTGYLYWGDVGPYSKVEGNEGTLSYDEINQARQAGFFGWPYFLGDNEAFPSYNFETKEEGPRFDPSKPLNNSPNNTGIRELPPAQPAFIWYGRLESAQFPLVGKGGATAMAGPVYYSDNFKKAPYKLSPYYDGKLFIYDWVRRWIMAVTIDSDGNYVSMEPFLSHLKLVAPMDMKFGPDGALYLLEYGTNWFSKNADARLLRIEYVEGNRNPIAQIDASRLYGGAPLTVDFSADASIDHDEGDVLEYAWDIAGKKYTGAAVSHEFSETGVFNATLTVRDNHGGKGTSSVQISVGNNPPEVGIHTTSNRSFYWDNVTFDYDVAISDEEDRDIDTNTVELYMTYVEQGKDPVNALMNLGTTQYLRGGQLVANLDCRACHSLEDESVGPSYKKIASRYTDKAGALKPLMEKVIQGGSGNWGTREMPPHPDMDERDAEEIVRYILSVNDKKENLPLRGEIELRDHIGKGTEGSYVLFASYSDKGANGIEPLKTTDYISLRNPLLQIEDYDAGNLRIGTITTAFLSYARTRHGGYTMFKDIDLTHIEKVTYRIQKHGAGGILELRTDSIAGNLISTIDIAGGEVKDLKGSWEEVVARVEATTGVKDVYLVFKNDEAIRGNLFHIDWLRFSNGR